MKGIKKVLKEEMAASTSTTSTMMAATESSGGGSGGSGGVTIRFGSRIFLWNPVLVPHRLCDF
jgi:hypothetical protein